MNFVTTAKPTVYPVGLAHAKRQARAADYTDDDEFLFSAISMATSFVETRIGRALITRTYKGFLDHWPWHHHDRHERSTQFRPGSRSDHRSVDLPMPPLQSVTSVITYDDTDTPTTMDPTTYYVDTAGFVGRLVRRKGVEWPWPARTANGIEINWVAGYGNNPHSIPDDLRHAILLLIDHFYEHRAAVVGVENRDSSTPLPLGVDDMVLPYRVYAF